MLWPLWWMRFEWPGKIPSKTMFEFILKVPNWRAVSIVTSFYCITQPFKEFLISLHKVFEKVYFWDKKLRFGKVCLVVKYVNSRISSKCCSISIASHLLGKVEKPKGKSQDREWDRRASESATALQYVPFSLLHYTHFKRINLGNYSPTQK